MGLCPAMDFSKKKQKQKSSSIASEDLVYVCVTWFWVLLAYSWGCWVRGISALLLTSGTSLSKFLLLFKCSSYHLENEEDWEDHRSAVCTCKTLYCVKMAGLSCLYKSHFQREFRKEMGTWKSCLYRCWLSPGMWWIQEVIFVHRRE